MGEGKKPQEVVEEGKSYDFEVVSIEIELRKISLKLAEVAVAKVAKAAKAAKPKKETNPPAGGKKAKE